MRNQAGVANRPFRVQTVQGEPYDVLGRSLVPVARIVSFGKGRASIRRDRVRGWAGGFCQVLPLAVIEESEQGERYIAISDSTGTVLRGILAAAAAMTLLFMAIRRLALVDRSHRRQGQE